MPLRWGRAEGAQSAASGPGWSTVAAAMAPKTGDADRPMQADSVRRAVGPVAAFGDVTLATRLLDGANQTALAAAAEEAVVPVAFQARDYGARGHPHSFKHLA